MIINHDFVQRIYREIVSYRVDTTTLDKGYVTHYIDAKLTDNKDEKHQTVVHIKAYLDDKPSFDIHYVDPLAKTNARIQQIINDKIDELKERYGRREEICTHRSVYRTHYPVLITRGYRTDDIGIVFWVDVENLVCKVIFDNGEVYGYDLNDIARLRPQKHGGA